LFYNTSPPVSTNNAKDDSDFNITDFLTEIHEVDRNMTRSTEESQARSAIGITNKHMKLKKKVVEQFTQILESIGKDKQRNLPFSSSSRCSF